MTTPNFVAPENRGSRRRPHDRRRTLVITVAALGALGLGACTQVHPVPADESDPLTKEEAARMDGKRDGFDLCGLFGWYGDGICDPFCPGADPDCECAAFGERQCLADDRCDAGYTGICDCTCPGPAGYEGGGCADCEASCFGFAACVERAAPPATCPDPSDSRVHYQAASHLDPAVCGTIDWDDTDCRADQTSIPSVCGCGCVDATCPDPGDPAVHYEGGSDTNPSICLLLDFVCADDQTWFSDDCGCGCIDEIAACPDPGDPAVHYEGGSDANPSICLLLDFVCADDQTWFSDDCGCGCIDEIAACPDPGDPRVHYIGDSHANPSYCLPILFGCDADQTLFSDECGCGCIDDVDHGGPTPS